MSSAFLSIASISLAPRRVQRCACARARGATGDDYLDEVFALEHPATRERIREQVRRAHENDVQPPTPPLPPPPASPPPPQGSTAESAQGGRSLARDVLSGFRLDGTPDDKQAADEAFMEESEEYRRRKGDPVLGAVPAMWFTKEEKSRRRDFMEDARVAPEEHLVENMKRVARACEEAENAQERSGERRRCSGCGLSFQRAQVQRNGGLCNVCYGERISESSPANLFAQDGGMPTQGTLGSSFYQEQRERELNAQPAEDVQQAMSTLFATPRVPQRRRGPSPTSLSVSDTPKMERNEGAPKQTTTDKRDREGAADPKVDGRGAYKPGWDRVKASVRSLRTVNPIRDFVQNVKVEVNPDKSEIRLDVGDPTTHGNLKVPSAVKDRLCEIIQSSKANGYPLSNGALAARKALADSQSVPGQAPLAPSDVLLFPGASGALEATIGALADEGDNILVPSPGFPLFRTQAEGHGVECRTYELDSGYSWRVKLETLREAVTPRTAAIVVNNPSNPCGSVYDKEHLAGILRIAEELCLPVIADEIYADMTFSGTEFVPMASVGSDVPILSVGGISKKFVVPGWRLGWVAIHDRTGILQKARVREGLQRLSTRMLLPNSLVQELVPWLIRESRNEGSEVAQGFRAVMTELESNAEFLMGRLKSVTGLRCNAPQGAMYVMVEIDPEVLGVEDASEFTIKLLEDENVRVIPGVCFQAPQYFRVVFSPERQVLAEACDRLDEFCEKLATRARKARSSA